MSPDGQSVRLAGRDVHLRPVEDAVSIHYLEPAPHRDRERAADRLGLAPTYDVRLEVVGAPITVYRLDASTRQASVRALGVTERAVGRVDPVFSFGTVRVAPVGRIILRAAPSVLEGLTRRGMLLVEQHDGTATVVLGETDDPFRGAEYLRRLDGVAWAEPEFAVMGYADGAGDRAGFRPSAASAHTPWADRLVGGPSARSALGGRAPAVVAVLDDGIEREHPALVGAVAEGADLLDEDSGGRPRPWDFHGTACAGLISAAERPGGVGGIARGGRLLAVRVAASPTAGANWTTSTVRLAAGIRWAVDHGADVLSLSWGGSVPSSAIEEALQHAATRGRRGRGCVLVAAAGNIPGPVDYPASAPGVLAVSATNARDEFKTPSSSDRETWWGSAFGREVALAAPSVSLPTTDLTGPAGLEQDGDAVFSGTSAGAPVVAATAALLLGARPAASAASIAELLRRTAAKVGGESYVDGRNDRLGWGRVDAAAAMAALVGSPVGGDDRGATPDDVAAPVPADRQPRSAEILLPLKFEQPTGPGRGGQRPPGPHEVLLPPPGGDAGRGVADGGAGLGPRLPGPRDVLLPVPLQRRAPTRRSPGPHEVRLG